MAGLKVAMVGHSLPDPVEIDLPKSPDQAKALLSLHNYTRVVTEDDTLIDHIAYLKKKKQVSHQDMFSVWEMNLCAGLLLTSMLRRNGIDCKSFNHLSQENEDQVFQEIESYQPDIIAFTTTFVLTPKHFIGVANNLKNRFPTSFLVCGGHHVFTTLLPMTNTEKKNYMIQSKVDCFVNDTQGEGAFLELVKKFKKDISQVPNLIWRNDEGEVIFNRVAAENNDINSTIIDFDYLDDPLIAHIRTARSCAFKCAFCSYPSIAGPLVTMELENIFDTMLKAKKAGLKALFFTDDTFNVPKDRFTKIIDGILERDLQIPWYSFARCQYLDENLIHKMKAAGCRGVFLGVESGSDKILKKMKKGSISSFYKNGVRWMKEAGIITVGSFIMGYPGETFETVEVTREFIENSGLDYYFIQPFYYLHHTPVHKRAKEFNLSGKGLFWSHSTMDWEEASEHVNRLFLEIKNSTFVNPDYTLWEIAYLQAKGMTLDEIKEYREEINQMTRSQMIRFGLTSKNSTRSIHGGFENEQRSLKENF